MIYGISGAPIQSGLAYAAEITTACGGRFSPCLAYAVANRETLRVERSGWLAANFPGKNACTVITSDGGHGIFQLTSSFPIDWDDPTANAEYAVDNFLVPAMHYFAGRGHSGDDLADLIADAFNAGTSRVQSYLSQGLKPDSATTGNDYGLDVVQCLHALITTGQPT